MEINWATIIPFIIGSILGFLAAFFIESKKRSWTIKDGENQIEHIFKGLEWEIEEGIKRCEGLVGFLKNKKISFSRIYTAYWNSARFKILKSSKKTEVINILHKIYYYFDLINFNMNHDRFGSGAAFANEYIDEIKQNFKEFKDKITEQGRVDNLRINSTNIMINEKASCYLNIAALATILSVGLVWKEYVALGLITFVYAVAAHLTDIFFHNIKGKDLSSRAATVLVIVEIIWFLVWIFLLWTFSK